MFVLSFLEIPAAISISSNERAPGLLIVANQEKEKYFFYNLIKSVENHIKMLTSYDPLLRKKGYFQDFHC